MEKESSKSDASHHHFAFTIGRFLVLYAIFLAFLFATLWAFIGLYFTLHWFLGSERHIQSMVISGGLVLGLILFTFTQTAFHGKK